MPTFSLNLTINWWNLSFGIGAGPIPLKVKLGSWKGTKTWKFLFRYFKTNQNWEGVRHVSDPPSLGVLFHCLLVLAFLGCRVIWRRFIGSYKAKNPLKNHSNCLSGMVAPPHWSKTYPMMAEMRKSIRQENCLFWFNCRLVLIPCFYDLFDLLQLSTSEWVMKQKLHQLLYNTILLTIKSVSSMDTIHWIGGHFYLTPSTWTAPLFDEWQSKLRFLFISSSATRLISGGV